jgi:hypothetical protein
MRSISLWICPLNIPIFPNATIVVANYTKLLWAVDASMSPEKNKWVQLSDEFGAE